MVREIVDDMTRAIILRPWEIRGLLDGTITQLRRLVKPQPPSEPEIVMRDIPGTPLWYAAVEAGRSDVGIEYRPVAQYDDYRLVCPYPPGTEIWGREAWRLCRWVEGEPLVFEFLAGGKQEESDDGCSDSRYEDWYETTMASVSGECEAAVAVFAKGVRWDDEREVYSWESGCNPLRWRSPATMPRWASRWSDIVAAVRVERVGDITEADAVRCGVISVRRSATKDGLLDGFIVPGAGTHQTSRRFAYAAQFDSDYGHGAFEANPWVWVIDVKGEFRET